MPFKWDADSERKLLLYVVKHCDVKPDTGVFNGVAASLGGEVNSNACKSVGYPGTCRLTCKCTLVIDLNEEFANGFVRIVSDSTSSRENPNSCWPKQVLKPPLHLLARRLQLLSQKPPPSQLVKVASVKPMPKRTTTRTLPTLRLRRPRRTPRRTVATRMVEPKKLPVKRSECK